MQHDDDFRPVAKFRRIEARLCRSKVRLELEFVGIDAKPKVHRRVLLLLPLLLLLLPSRAEPPIMVRSLRRRRRNPPLPARLKSVSASPIPPSRRSTSGVPTRSSSRGADATSTTLFRRWRAPGGRIRSTCDGRRPFFRERRRPGKGRRLERRAPAVWARRQMKHRREGKGNGGES